MASHTTPLSVHVVVKDGRIVIERIESLFDEQVLDITCVRYTDIVPLHRIVDSQRIPHIPGILWIADNQIMEDGVQRYRELHPKQDSEHIGILKLDTLELLLITHEREVTFDLKE